MRDSGNAARLRPAALRSQARTETQAGSASAQPIASEATASSIADSVTATSVKSVSCLDRSQKSASMAYAIVGVIDQCPSERLQRPTALIQRRATVAQQGRS